MLEALDQFNLQAGSVSLPSRVRSRIQAMTREKLEQTGFVAALVCKVHCKVREAAASGIGYIHIKRVSRERTQETLSSPACTH